MPERDLSCRRRHALCGTALGGVLLVLALGAGSSGAPRESSSAPPARGTDSSAFLTRAMTIGNLGSVTCNERRYAISPDWTTLAAPQDRGSVLLFDVATGKPLPPLEGGFKVGTFTYTYADGVPASHFAFSVDGRFVVWHWGKKVVVWEVATRKIVLKWETEGTIIAQGRIRDTTLPDGGLELWAGATGQSVSSAGNPASSADGRFTAFVNGSDDVEVRHLAQPDSPPRVLPMREKGNHGRCTFFDSDRARSGPQLLLSHDGHLLADSCRITDVWDLSQPTPRLVVRTGLLRTTAGRPVLSRDGKTLAYSWGGGSQLGGDGGFGLVDVDTASPVGSHIEVKYLGAMEFSPDGAHLATVGWVPRPGSKRTFEVVIWSVESMRSGGSTSR